MTTLTTIGYGNTGEINHYFWRTFHTFVLVTIVAVNIMAFVEAVCKAEVGLMFPCISSRGMKVIRITLFLLFWNGYALIFFFLEHKPDDGPQTFLEYKKWLYFSTQTGNYLS